MLVIDFEVEIRFKREVWSNGRVPSAIDRNKIFIFARAFLYALDTFDKFLSVLSAERGVPDGFEKFTTRMKEDFPNLRMVRNSAQHLEERARGIGAHGKKLVLRPIKNALISAPNGGVLMLNCLNGSRYGSTMADGHYGEVDVSHGSMDKLQKILQDVLNHFNWEGSEQHLPS